MLLTRLSQGVLALPASRNMPATLDTAFWHCVWRRVLDREEVIDHVASNVDLRSAYTSAGS